MFRYKLRTLLILLFAPECHSASPLTSQQKKAVSVGRGVFFLMLCSTFLGLALARSLWWYPIAMTCYSGFALWCVVRVWRKGPAVYDDAPPP
jgi:hypothetical protein